MLSPWKQTYDKPRQCIKKQRQHFANQGPYSQNYGFSSSHVQMWELGFKEGWVTNNWHLRLMVLEKTLVCSTDCKEIKPVNPKRSQSWIFTGRIDAEGETPILWPPDMKSQFTGMTLMVGKTESKIQFSSVPQSCPTLCDPMNSSTAGLPVHHQLLEFTQTHVHRVSDAIQPSHPLSSPSPPAPNPSQN